MKGTPQSSQMIWMEQRIRELEDQLAEKDAEIANFYTTFHKYYDGTINELVEEWQSLRKDAERYRFIYGNLPNAFHAAIDQAMGEKE